VKIVQLVGVVLSLLVLGAHFLRAGATLLVVAVIALLVILAVRRPWVARAVQVALLIGTAEWLRTIANLTRERMNIGEPYLRMVAILGAVAVVTFLSAAAFQFGSLGRTYGLGRQPPDD
jgi:hypothetical protein